MRGPSAIDLMPSFDGQFHSPQSVCPATCASWKLATRRPGTLSPGSALPLATMLLATASGCTGHPYQFPWRDFHMKIRVIDNAGRPIQRAEIWVDDGREVAVLRVLPDSYACRLANGSWAHTPFKPGRGCAPGEVPWHKYYEPASPLPEEIRILILRDGQVAAFLRRPLGPKDSWQERRSCVVETVTVNGADAATRPSSTPRGNH